MRESDGRHLVFTTHGFEMVLKDLFKIRRKSGRDHQSEREKQTAELFHQEPQGNEGFVTDPVWAEQDWHYSTVTYTQIPVVGFQLPFFLPCRGGLVGMGLIGPGE